MRPGCQYLRSPPPLFFVRHRHLPSFSSFLASLIGKNGLLYIIFLCILGSYKRIWISRCMHFCMHGLNEYIVFVTMLKIIFLKVKKNILYRCIKWQWIRVFFSSFWEWIRGWKNGSDLKIFFLKIFLSFLDIFFLFL